MTPIDRRLKDSYSFFTIADQMLGIDCCDKPLLAKKQEFRCGSYIIIQSISGIPKNKYEYRVNEGKFDGLKELLSHSSNSSWVISDRVLPGVGAWMPRIRSLKGNLI
jgi:hypothetical protein